MDTYELPLRFDRVMMKLKQTCVLIVSDILAYAGVMQRFLLICLTLLAALVRRNCDDL